MKHLTSISSGIRSVAKLTLLSLFCVGTMLGADNPSPFAPIVGVWMTHFDNGTNRVYRINEDGSLSYEQPAPADAKSSKIEVIKGELTADFGNRISVFGKPANGQMNVATFASRANLDANQPVTTGKAYRAVASNPSDPVIGTWKWLLDEQRNMDGIVEFKADGTFTMVGTSKIGLWKLNGDRSYVLNWVGIGSEDTMVLSADRNGISGKNRSGRLIFGERMQTVAANSVVVPSTPVPVSPPGPAAIAPARATDRKTVASANQQPLPPNGATPTTALIAAIPVAQKQLQLDRGWDTPMQGGTATINDLSRLFGTMAKPNVDLSTTTDASIYDQITYLMPVRQAMESLKLNVRAPSKVLIACPGFPRDSLYYYALDGRFEGTYNRMYLVVDRADQVVSVELVDEAPKLTGWHSHEDQGWHTYDFVNARVRALNTLRVEQHVALWTATKFEENNDIYAFAPVMSAKNAGWKVARVDSALLTTDRYGQAKSERQQTRWYVPRPLVELILTCVQKAGK